MSQTPSELKYASSHEWARLEEDGTVTVGISDHCFVLEVAFTSQAGQSAGGGANIPVFSHEGSLHHRTGQPSVSTGLPSA